MSTENDTFNNSIREALDYLAITVINVFEQFKGLPQSEDEVFEVGCPLSSQDWRASNWTNEPTYLKLA